MAEIFPVGTVFVTQQPHGIRRPVREHQALWSLVFSLLWLDARPFLIHSVEVPQHSILCVHQVSSKPWITAPGTPAGLLCDKFKTGCHFSNTTIFSVVPQ